MHLENAGLVRAWLDNPGQVPWTKRFETYSEGDATCPGGDVRVCEGSREGQGGALGYGKGLVKGSGRPSGS